MNNNPPIGVLLQIMILMMIGIEMPPRLRDLVSNPFPTKGRFDQIFEAADAIASRMTGSQPPRRRWFQRPDPLRSLNH